MLMVVVVVVVRAVPVRVMPVSGMVVIVGMAASVRHAPTLPEAAREVEPRARASGRVAQPADGSTGGGRVAVRLL